MSLNQAFRIFIEFGLFHFNYLFIYCVTVVTIVVLFCLRIIIGVICVFRGIMATIAHFCKNDRCLGIIILLVNSNKMYYCTVGLL